MNSLHSILASMMAVVLLSGCVTMSWETEALRQDVQSLRNEQEALQASLRNKEHELTTMIDDARGEVQRLREVLTEATALLKRNSADVGAELEEARREVNTLRNQLETALFRLERLEQDLQLTKEDVDLRISESETQKESNPDEAFAAAKKDLTDGSFRRARTALERFAKRNPKHPAYVEALFLIGRAYFGEKQWVSSIFAFQTILEKHPKSKFTPEATYRMGAAFEALGKCEEAEAFFDTVIADHPSSPWKAESSKRKKAIATGKCSPQE